MMPHPENHVEDIMGCTDGRGLFAGLVAASGEGGVAFSAKWAVRVKKRVEIKMLAAAVAALLRSLTAAGRAKLSQPSHHHDRAVRGRRHFRRDRARGRRADERSLGQPIVIENVAGAGGSIALTRAARAEPDGYTIAIGNAGTSAATYTIYPKLPFTPDSFVPIAMVAKTFGIIALRKDFPAKNLQEFLAYAKSNPGKVNLGHAGVGSSNFLICRSFVQAAGIEVTLVGYRGAAPALTDTIGGQIDGVCDAAASVAQPIGDKLVRGLVVGSTVRLAYAAGPADLGGSRACPNSRRRAGTACSRRRARRPRSLQNSTRPRKPPLKATR